MRATYEWELTAIKKTPKQWRVFPVGIKALLVPVSCDYWGGLDPAFCVSDRASGTFLTLKCTEEAAHPDASTSEPVEVVNLSAYSPCLCVKQQV